jgi:hypothetical protein
MFITEYKLLYVLLCTYTQKESVCKSRCTSTQINALAVFSVKWPAVMNTMEYLILQSRALRYLNFTTQAKKFPTPAPSAQMLGAYKLAQLMPLA